MSFDVPVGKNKRRKGDKDGSSGKKASLIATSASHPLDKKVLAQTAMKISITRGSFIDTKFYAYSRRTASGSVDTPRALYANSAILKASCKYFEGLLAGGYRECVQSSFDEPFPTQSQISTGEYDYLSDSDLDDEEDAPIDSFPYQEESKELVSTQSFQDVGAYGQLAEEKSDDSSIADSSATTTMGLRGNVIILHDISYRTLKALIFYLYTDEISFAPLRSQNIKRPDEPALHEAPPCSPKSIYRIADKFGLDKLKEKAASDLYSKITPKTILPELFSTITATFDEIRSKQVAYACDSLVQVVVAAEISPWISRIVNGELGHCEGVLIALVKGMAEASQDQSKMISTQDQSKMISTKDQSKMISTSEWRTSCARCSYSFQPQIYKRCSSCYQFIDVKS